MNPMGGFARRMSYWKAFEKKYPAHPMLRMDAGSIFSRNQAASSATNRWMAEGIRLSDMDAVNLSAWDLPAWREIADLATAGLAKREILYAPLVSANVASRVPNFPKIRSYIIKEPVIDPKSGKRLRIGITGLMEGEVEGNSAEGFDIVDPETAARRIIEEMREKTDYRIVLTDMDMAAAGSLAVMVPGIDMIVVAHDYAAISDPQQMGRTLVVAPVTEGRMLSEIRLKSRGPDKNEIQARFVPLDRSIPDDPAMADLIRRAERDVQKAKP